MNFSMKVGLFIPCYINALYPRVASASYELLVRLGCDVEYPLDQTCCGQPMANAGFEQDARPLAERMNALFARYDYVVAPSASCVVFVREGYPRLLEHREGHACVDSRIWEICEFIHDVVRPERLDPPLPPPASVLDVWIDKEFSSHDLDRFNLQSLSFCSSPGFIECPICPSDVFLVNSVDIWRILTGNLDCLDTFVLSCGAKDCVFGDILVFLIAYILDMHYYVCFSDRNKSERFDAPVLSGRSNHCSIALPRRPADFAHVRLV